MVNKLIAAKGINKGSFEVCKLFSTVKFNPIFHGPGSIKPGVF
jgi:hypothetical protein